MALFRPFLALALLPAIAGCSMFARDTPPAPPPMSVDEVVVEVAEEPSGLGGMFGTLFGSPAVADDGGSEATSAALPVIPEEDSGGGFLSFLGGFGAGEADEEVAIQISASPGQTVPFGQMAVACGLSTRDLGREVERASGYRVYDTNPGTTAPRTHFITGFSDGCARQFTAALVIFGDIGTHELVRYGTADGGLPYSETDNAYERIKADVCGVRTGQPCGSRLDRFARRTTFLTVYQGFGSGARWVDVLLHDGDIAAIDTL